MEPTTPSSYAYSTPSNGHRGKATRGRRGRAAQRRAAIYCRISDDLEGRGLGVARQEQECRELCADMGLEVIEVLSDNDISAFNRKHRPGYELLKDLMADGEVDVLVAWASDRITRHPIELEELIDLLDGNRIDVHTKIGGEIDLTTSDGRLKARIMGAVARNESEKKSERVKSRYRQKIAAGEPSGGPAPYGYRRASKNYVIDPETAAHVRWIAGEVLAGVRLVDITAMLNDKKIPSHKGGKWHPGRVKRVVTNPAVANLREYRPRDRDGKQLEGEIIGDGTWEPILERATWDAVCAILMNPLRMRDLPFSRYPLTGLLYSATNDKIMRGQRDDAGRNGVKKRVYMNTTAYLDADGSEALVFATALELVESGTYAAVRPVPMEDVGALEAELDRIMQLKNAGRITLDEWLELRDPVQERLQAARPSASKRGALKVLRDPQALRLKWEREDEERGVGGDYTPDQLIERRGVAQAVFERIRVLRATRARWTPMEERLEMIPRP